MNNGHIKRLAAVHRGGWGNRLQTCCLMILACVIISCTYAKTRKFIVSEEPSRDNLFGWYFDIEFSAYLGKTDKGIPPGQENVFAFYDFDVILDKGYTGPIYGIDIDTLFMTLVETNDKIIWIKKSGDYISYSGSDICNRFRFWNPIGGGAVLINPWIDTLLIEFDARFYKGYIKQFYLNSWFEEHEFSNDSVGVADDSTEDIVKRIRIMMIRKESKVLTPSWI